MHRSSKFSASAVFVFFALASLCGPAAADDDSPPAGDAVAAAPVAAATPAAQVAAERRCFTVDRIVLDNLPAELAWLQNDVARYRGSCVDVRTADLIARDAQNALLARGYATTRVRIPEQDISHGEFHLLVTPGYLREVKVKTTSPLVSWKNAFPTRPGHLLNVRDLEQGLEQMKRVPSQDVQMQIAPGKHPGDSELDIAVTRSKRWHLAVDVNDGGSSQTGPIQSSVTFSLDSPLHLNDLLNVSLNHSVSGGVGSGTRGNNAYYSIPFGYWTVELAAGNNNYTQTIAGRNATFTLSGTAHNGSLALERMLQRSQTAKTSVTMRVQQTSSHSFLNDTEIDVQRRNSSFGEIVFKRETQGSNGSLSVAAGFRAGLPLFGALPDLQGVANAPTSYYTMQTLDVNASTVLSRKNKIRFTTHFNGQFTGDRTATSNLFSIGNRYTVRGFDGETGLAAESGYYLRNEVEVPLRTPSRSVYFAYDTGAVWGPTAEGLAGTSLRGAAVGLRGGNAHASFDVFTGFALGAPAGLHTAEPAGGINLTYRI